MPGDLDDDTPLISSGLLDSLALFDLALWIEDRVGAPVDPEALDIGHQWDSLGRIVTFVEHRRSASPHRPPPLKGAEAIPSSLRVETFTPAHAAAVARLQTGLWTPDPDINLRYLRWKYEENPYHPVPRIYLAYDGRELVGMRGFYPSRWEIGRAGDFSDVLVADDLYVRADHRNRGVVRALMQTALADLHETGVDYVFNLSGAPVTVMASLATGWRSAGPLQPRARSSTSHALLAAVRTRISKRPFLWRYRSSSHLYTAEELRPFARLDAHSSLASERSGIRCTIAREARPQEMARLVSRLGYDGRIRHVRDAAYLTWRYQNPLNEYRFFYADSTDLRGFLVLKWTRAAFGPNPRVQIVDWEAEDEACLVALLDAALSAGGCPELMTWSATLGEPRTALLTRYGFVPSDPQSAAHGCPCVLVRACDPSRSHEDWRLRGAPLLEADRWDIRMIYSMAG